MSWINLSLDIWCNKCPAYYKKNWTFIIPQIYNIFHTPKFRRDFYGEEAYTEHLDSFDNDFKMSKVKKNQKQEIKRSF